MSDMQEPHGVLAWAVIGPSGRILKGTIRPQPRGAVASLAASDAAWRELVAAGFRLGRVRVAELAEAPPPTRRRPREH